MVYSFILVWYVFIFEYIHALINYTYKNRMLSLKYIHSHLYCPFHVENRMCYNLARATLIYI